MFKFLSLTILAPRLLVSSYMRHSKIRRKESTEHTYCTAIIWCFPAQRTPKVLREYPKVSIVQQQRGFLQHTYKPNVWNFKISSHPEWGNDSNLPTCKMPFFPLLGAISSYSSISWMYLFICSYYKNHLEAFPKHCSISNTKNPTSKIGLLRSVMRVVW
jgi:hypothetical protein